MLTIGIDIGSVATKAVMMEDGKKIIAKHIRPTGWSPKESGKRVYQELLDQGGMQSSQIEKVIGTGYGRIAMDFADKVVTEITCHGKGAHFLHPKTETIIDIGGQDSKVIRINKEGQVLDFLMNDKCAAGTGKFLEVMANSLAIDISQLSSLADGEKGRKITNMCTVFAESEVISLLAEGAGKGEIARGLLESTADKAMILGGRVGMVGEVFFSGGVSKIPLLREIMDEKMKNPLIHSEDSQYIGAIGAAIVGAKKP